MANAPRRLPSPIPTRSWRTKRVPSPSHLQPSRWMASNTPPTACVSPCSHPTNLLPLLQAMRAQLTNHAKPPRLTKATSSYAPWSARARCMSKRPSCSATSCILQAWMSHNSPTTPAYLSSRDSSSKSSKWVRYKPNWSTTMAATTKRLCYTAPYSSRSAVATSPSIQQSLRQCYAYKTAHKYAVYSTTFSTAIPLPPRLLLRLAPPSMWMPCPQANQLDSAAV